MTNDNAGDGIELIALLEVLWARKWFIVGGTLATMLVVVVASLFTPRVYRATATLLVAESKIPPLPGVQGAAKAEFSPQTFETMIRNQSLALDTIQHFGLHAKVPGITPERFLRDVLSVESRRDANVLVVDAVLPNPQLAADVVNYLAGKAVALNTALNQSDTLTTQEYIQKQLAEANQKMEAAQAALTNFKRSANLESLRAEQRVLLEAKVRFAELEADYAIRIRGHQADLKELRKSLDAQKPLLVLNKSVFSDPALLTAAQEQGSKGLKALSGVELRTEEINQTYQTVQKNLIEKEGELAALQGQHEDVSLRQKATELQLRQVANKVVETETRLDELSRIYEIEKTACQLFATKLNETSFSVASRAAELKILDPAILPTQPDRASVPLILVMAGALGLGGFVVLAFFLEYLQRSRRGRK